MKTIALVFTVLVMTGCAALRPASPPVVIDSKAPVCSGKAQCEEMWIQAQQTIEVVTLMRVRLVTDERIVTYDSLYNPAGIWGEVTRHPIGKDAYELRVSIDCVTPIGCNTIRTEATNAFNLFVGRSSSMMEK